MAQNALNLGILAHVDAGKTILTERLPDAAGIIDKDRQPHCSHESRAGSA